MRRRMWVAGVLVVCLGFLPGVGLGAEAEQAGTEPAAPGQGAAEPSASPAAPEPAPIAPEPAAPAAPAPAPLTPPALKPITISFAGELMSVDAAGAPPKITVQDRYGVKKEIAVPSEAKVTDKQGAKSLADLKVGARLTVEYTYDVATGSRTAQQISLDEQAAASR